MLSVPFENLRHAFARKTVVTELRRGDGTLAQPMPAPPITFISVGGLLKTLASQRVQHPALDRLDGRRKVGDQMMRIGIEADDGRVRQKRRDGLIRTVRGENLVVHARQIILLKPADGFRRAQHRLPDPVRVEPHQRAVALPNLDDAIFDGHTTGHSADKKNTQWRFGAQRRRASAGRERELP